MTMRKTLTTIVLAGALALGVTGCKDDNPESQRKSRPSHFATVPMSHQTGVSITSGDFDGDGNLDLIVGAGYPTKNELRLYFLKNQNGRFSEPSHFATVPMSHQTGVSITSGDFDGDGNLDLIVGAGYPTKNELRLYRFNNDGRGNFSQ